ncbi:hypothetical protein I3843_15G052800 [Carya illinoinensis]|nr:hypothetical protein I3843_15G052800 [Carya illinoinensis]
MAAKCTIRGCIKTPTSLGQSPSVSEWGYVPSIGQLGFQSQNVGFFTLAYRLYRCRSSFTQITNIRYILTS